MEQGASDIQNWTGQTPGKHVVTLEPGIGLDDFQRPHPTQTSLRLYSVIHPTNKLLRIVFETQTFAPEFTTL